MTRRGLAVLGVAGMVAIFVALVPISLWLNRPNILRLESAKAALAEAGYPGARVSRAQRIAEMARCEVGQVRNRGRAYGWKTDTHSGVFCQPTDGRPSRILLDP